VTVVAVCASKGSWGASTLALLIGAGWPSTRQVVVAECDPGGNALAARFELSPLVGMTSLVLDRRRLVDKGLAAHLQSVPGGLEVLVGPASPGAARSLDHEIGDLGERLFPSDVDVIADCGRIATDSRGQAGLVTSAADVVITVGGDAASVAHAQWTSEHISSAAPDARITFVLVGTCPFPAEEIRHALPAGRIHSLPSDPRAAGMVCGLPGRPKHLEHGPLARAARRLVCDLTEGLSGPSAAPLGRQTPDGAGHAPGSIPVSTRAAAP